jgi:spore germination protein GerM
VTPSWDGSDLQTGTEEMTLKAAVDDLLRGIDSVPQNAVLLEHGKKDGVLTLNFSSEFDSGYGSSAEQAILNGLRALAGQDPEVEELMILVEGQIVETLGHFEIMEPIPVHRSEA